MTPIARLACTLLGLAATLVPASSANAQGGTAPPAGAGATDVFILRQIIEINNELRAMRREMDELRRRLDERPGPEARARAGDTVPAPRAPAAAAAAPAATAEIALSSTDPSLGEAGAQVVLVEFSDYQCPFCARFHAQTFPEIKKRYIDTGKVRYVLKDYPLPMHTKAPAASVAARCAGAQDKYWEMKAALFARQRELGDELYGTLAAEMGLDADRFTACLSDGKVREAVDAATALGRQAGVSGTPTFFVGRLGDGKVVDAVRLVGAQPVASFTSAIDGLLAGR